ncbi:MAG TPA: hypothetical protein VGD29_21825 [Actinoplanes sp.]
MTDNVFGGDVEHRLRRASDRVRAAAGDAQARDWVAERPDRVGFARLAQAEFEINQAAGRFGAGLPPHWLRTIAGTFVGAAVSLTILLAARDAASLPALLVAIGVGPVVAQVLVAMIGRRNRRATTGPPVIDDPYFYGDLTRRLEACAAAARVDRSEKHRAAADDIGRALVWLPAARRED